MGKIYLLGFGLTSLQTLSRLPRKMGFCATQHSNKLLICEPQLSENMVSNGDLGCVFAGSGNETSR